MRQEKPSGDIDDPWMTTAEAARYLGFSKKTVERHQEALGATTLFGGRHLRFKRSRLDCAMTPRAANGRFQVPGSLQNKSRIKEQGK